MRIITSPDELRRWRQEVTPGRRIAFVPTMGFLHEGHVSLLNEGRRRVPQSDGELVLSIFVNPTQFGPTEDLAAYPRDLNGDLAKARASGVDVTFVPDTPELMYPSRATWVDVEGLSSWLCGASRPGHFRGVCTIVAKLWNLVQPHVAIFGEKDFQQLAIIRRMHADLFLSGEVVGMAIVREADGLAMSSRNKNLSPQARHDANAIPRFLDLVRQRFVAGTRSRTELLAGSHEFLVPGVVDYVDLVDAATLQPVVAVVRPAVAAVAVRFGGVRLIDNAILVPEAE